MTASPHRSPASSFEIVATAMLIGCIAGGGAGATVGALTDREPAEVGLLASVALLAGCVLGALLGTAWCVARRRRRTVHDVPEEPATPIVDSLPPPDDRRPGWRADPAGAGRRLWDGEHWTQHVWSDRGRST